jgi:hypothetical protein
VPQVGAAYQQNKGAGLDVLFVLGENQSRGKPTLAYCKSYANQYGLPPEKVVVDNGTLGGWEVLFGAMNPYLSNTGELSLPWDGILDGDNMEYKYSSGNHNGFKDVNAALQSIMSN